MPTPVLTTLELPYAFEGTRAFIEGPDLFTYHRPYGRPERLMRVGDICRWLVCSPTTAFDSFGASETTVRAAERAESMADMARETGSRHTLGRYVGPLGARYQREGRWTEDACVLLGSMVWGVLAQRLLERAAELYEQGECLLLVEAERKEDATPRRVPVIVGHDARPTAARRRARRAGR